VFEDKPRLDEHAIAARAAKELREGQIVNLGFGIPMLVSSYVEPKREVLLHSENGVLGFGPVVEDQDKADRNCINGGGQPVTKLPGMCFMSHDDSFALIRGGWVDYTLLGALEVAANGDLANYHIPGRIAGSFGGGQDLAYCAKAVIALMTHTTKDGRPKIVNRLTLPMTAPRCVKMIISDIAVIDLTPDGLVLREVLGGWEPDEVQKVTEPELIVPAEVGEITL
jgi:3-oxoacid CoA-transferase B subunit